MPVHALWDEEEPDLVRLTFAGMWTWNEAMDAMYGVRKLCRERPGRVDVIADVAVPYLPPGVCAGVRWLTAQGFPSSNLHLVVMVVNPLAHLLFTHCFRKKTCWFDYAFAPTVARARAVIRAARKDEAVPLYLPHAHPLN